MKPKLKCPFCGEKKEFKPLKGYRLPGRPITWFYGGLALGTAIWAAIGIGTCWGSELIC